MSLFRTALLTCVAVALTVAAARASTPSSTPAPTPAATPAGTTGSPPIFTDEAAAWGIDFVHFNGMSGEYYLPEITGAGAGLLDYDGDGDLDVYLIQGTMLGPGRTLADAIFAPRHPSPLSDRLYRNDTSVGPDGTPRVRFVDVTEASGLATETTDYGMGIAVGDYDGDGDQDVYLANYGHNRLLRNEGDGTFSDVTEASGTDDRRWSVAATFFDYDDDGLLDLYTADYTDFSMAVHTICKTSTGSPDYCGPLVYEPLPDRLFHNRGPSSEGTTFEDVTAQAGMASARGSGLGVVAADFDGDGTTDLYVANDGMENLLWRNRGDGTFVEDAMLAGCAVNWEGKAEASMGVMADDVDGDGDEDLFMTHLAEQTNTLYLNDGTGLFQDQTIRSGLGTPSLGATTFGAGFLDLENDGDLDLLAGNGAVVLIEDLVRQGDPYPLDQRNQLFRNRGDLRFEEITDQAGPALDPVEVTRGIAFGDVDGDGDTDALVSNNSGPARLLIDRIGQDRGWIGLRLLDHGRPALMARAAVWGDDGKVRWRRVRTDGSFASSGDPRIIAGLDAADAPSRVEVHWPDGSVLRLAGLPGERYLTIERQPPDKAGTGTGAKTGTVR